MEQTLINYLNNINFYASAVRKSGKIEDKRGDELTFEAMGLDVMQVSTELARLNYLTLKVKKLKKKDEDLIAEQEQARLKARETLFSTNCITELSEINDPFFIHDLVEKNPVFVAYNQHGLIFNRTIELIGSEQRLLKAYQKNLAEVNLSFKIIQHLNNAVMNQDSALYEKINNIIKERISELPRVIAFDDMPLQEVVLGCVRRNIYFDETHPNFDWCRATIHHPSIYIAKAVLSKTLYSLEKH
ncbi:hypothetical protein [Vibrio splendidus]|uniref:hypothetical protein n=1 Tax=Vibrio splendidus TaxID=29497 RepID=UPI003D0CB5ED